MAGVKISALPAVSSALTTDFFPVVQGGVTSQETLSQVQTLFGFSGGILNLSHGGTNANLTSNNGGIVWSNATQLQILAGTSTADQILLSGSLATPSWSTATYPSTTTINQLIYSSSANVLTGLATNNDSGLLTNGTGVPGWVAYTGSGAPVLGTSPTITTPNIVGTSTNNNAAAGSIGEFIFSQVAQASATSLTVNTQTSITSISLTDGDWDVEGNAGVIASVSINNMQAGISITNNTLPDGSLTTLTNSGATGTISITPVVSQRISIASPTTVYLVVISSFNGIGTMFGYLSARRRR